MAADVATSLKNWSTTPGSNSPAGGTAISTNLDDNLREIQAVVRDLAASNTIASATTCDIGAVDETFLTVTGTTTITGFGTVSDSIYKWLTFSGALTLTHNATSLILPGGANITTAAGDTCLMRSLGSGNWKCMVYSPASGLSVAAVSSIADGTVSLPGLAFTLDINTGMYRIGADNLGLTANGTKVADFNTTRSLFPGYVVSGTDPGGAYAFKAGEDGNVGGFYYENTSYTFNGHLVWTNATISSGNAHYQADHRAAGGGTTYLFVGRSNVASSADTEFSVTTAGAVSSDGGTAMTTPADYAEMFEWADGNPTGEDRVGYPVALVGKKIKIAEVGDTPVGIVSGNPAVLGDAGSLRWVDKYLRDEFNRPLLNEDGTRVLNPAFDPQAVYTPRIERKEWSPIGLVGKLRMRKGQVTNPNWIKMEDISATVEEWLVK